MIGLSVQTKVYNSSVLTLVYSLPVVTMALLHMFIILFQIVVLSLVATKKIRISLETFVAKSQPAMASEELMWHLEPQFCLL